MCYHCNRDPYITHLGGVRHAVYHCVRYPSLCSDPGPRKAYQRHLISPDHSKQGKAISAKEGPPFFSLKRPPEQDPDATCLDTHSSCAVLQFFDSHDRPISQKTILKEPQQAGDYVLLTRDLASEPAKQVAESSHCIQTVLIPPEAGQRNTVSSPHAAIVCKDDGLYLAKFARFKPTNGIYLWSKTDGCWHSFDAQRLDSLYDKAVQLGDCLLCFSRPVSKTPSGRDGGADQIADLFM